MGGLVYIQGGGTAVSAAFYKASTQAWSRLATGLSMGNYQEMIAYDPVHKAVLFGGGGGNSNWYAVNSSGTVTQKKNAPVSFDVNGDILKPDPVTGKIFLFPYGGGTSYEYDYPSDAWSTFSGSNPPFTPGISISAPVSTYGVILFVTNSSVYLYKHASMGASAETGAGTLSPPLEPEISPNPFRSSVNIHLPGGAGSCSILDLSGRVVKRLGPAMTGSLVWNAGNAPAGIYLLRFTVGKENYVRKILLQK
jgi:hypothetical protein